LARKTAASSHIFWHVSILRASFINAGARHISKRLSSSARRGARLVAVSRMTHHLISRGVSNIGVFHRVNRHRRIASAATPAVAISLIVMAYGLLRLGDGDIYRYAFAIRAQSA